MMRSLLAAPARGLLIASLALLACNESEDPASTIPVPELVAASDVTEETENVYYREWCTVGEVIPEGEAILAELLEEEIAISRIWFPVQCSPCDCVTCTAAIVVELFAADARIEAMNFIPDNPWVLNCGVPSMWRYTFPAPPPGSLYR